MDEIKISLLALGFVGFSFALLLAFLSKKLKVEQDPRIDKILNILPGLNCGACGFSGCLRFAEAAVKECSIFNGCLPGGSMVNEQIAESLGIVGCLSRTNLTAICHCGADAGEKKNSHIYLGPETCKAASLIGAGLDCLYGCLGFGDCLLVCPANAISIKNKKVYVDRGKCIGCGKCAAACPRNLFEVIATKKEMPLVYYVACNNKDKALNVKRVCSRGCISCAICIKVTDSPFVMRDNLSRIDREKVKSDKPLEEAKQKCPTKCIV